MYQPFIINLAIVLIVLVGIVVTHNPLMVLVLLMLQPMTWIPPQMMMPPVEDDEPKIGFMAPIGDQDYEDD